MSKNYNSNFNQQIGIDFQLSTMNDITQEIKKISTKNEDFFKSSLKSDFQQEDNVISAVRSKAGPSNDNIKKLNDYKSNLEEKLKGIKSKMTPELVKIDYKKFSNIPSKALINLLYFFDTIDLFQITQLNKEIKTKVLNIFIDYGKRICEQFNNIYLRQIKSENRLITFHKYKRNKRGHLKVSLIIKAKILSEKFKDKTVSFGYNAKFPSDKEKLKNVYKFDVRAPGPLSFWVMREYTYV